jgi:hypothetical protein
MNKLILAIRNLGANVSSINFSEYGKRAVKYNLYPHKWKTQILRKPAKNEEKEAVIAILRNI